MQKYPRQYVEYEKPAYQSKLICKCTGCGRYFSTAAPFTLHRIGSHAKRERHCMNEEQLAKAQITYDETLRVWIGKKMSPRRRAKLDALRAAKKQAKLAARAKAELEQTVHEASSEEELEESEDAFDDELEEEVEEEEEHEDDEKE